MMVARVQLGVALMTDRGSEGTSCSVSNNS